MNNRTVVIAGGGASGALTAANLLMRAPGTRVIVLEPAERLGRGMAYSTTCPLHLLNVPAQKMSAFPDDPGHFLRWLHGNGFGHFDGTSFVPRMIYGDYLEATMEAARNNADSNEFLHIREEAVACSEKPRGIEITLSGGRTVNGDALVLASGNPAPAPWPGLDPELVEAGRYRGVAWQSGALAADPAARSVLLLGTGLTAVDAALALRHNGHHGPIYMVSRRGLLPMTHRIGPCHPMPCAPASSARELVANLRASARDAEILYQDWRIAVDGVRAQTNEFWQSLCLDEQRRLLRHARAWWDVHRHRMAPQIASSIHSLISQGIVRVHAGRIGRMESTEQGVRVPIQLRGENVTVAFDVARVVNCTGPEVNPLRSNNPLLLGLISAGLLRAHPLRTGSMVDGSGALIGRSGAASERFFAVGPLRFGSLFETVAIPEIRQQAAELAMRLAPAAQRIFQPVS